MTIRYSPAALEDIRNLKRYLAEEFGSAVAAKSVREVVSDIARLKRFPNLMRPLSEKTGRETEYQYFLCGRYSISILLNVADVISVIRIFDGRTDYVSHIFG